MEDRLQLLREVSDQTKEAATMGFRRQRRRNTRHKSAKQLLSDEQKRINAVLSAETAPKPNVTYFSVEAPPSLRPARKYCDVTGLRANYTSPTNNLRYHSAEIYQLVVKPMPAGVDQEYLKLRGANFVLK
ncbi:Chromatin-remodeling complex subunit IES6 [Nakaseomyces bracarensis]|uniref:Chromatin-remodeling complex subunit IES6 n=1 Tax=Nakaseomyces bracarensis TaxID=273131 RepID=A0ABR4NLS4_9SACH